MSRFSLRSFIDHVLFVVLIMAGAMASAALESGAVLGPWPAADGAVAAAIAPFGAAGPVAAASSVDGTLLSAAAPRSGRRVR